MKISLLEKQDLLTVYKADTGNSISGSTFSLSSFIEWMEEKLITLLIRKEA